MKHNYTTILNRSVISISGEDKKTFLQGLITNDINKANESQAIYALMLNPQGRFLYDFFIIEHAGKLLLDVTKEKVDEIIKKLSFYKLRSKVVIAPEPDLIVAWGLNKIDTIIVFADPRNEQMGWRAIINNNEAVQNQEDYHQYNLHRLHLKIPDDSDLTFDKSLPLEFDFDNLNAISYQKGCYVGQETTARTHYKGTIRKKIFLIEIDGVDQVIKGAEINADDKKIGEILSSCRDENKNKLLALTLIKNLDNDGKEINLENLQLTIADNKLAKINLV